VNPGFADCAFFCGKASSSGDRRDVFIRLDGSARAIVKRKNDFPEKSDAARGDMPGDLVPGRRGSAGGSPLSGIVRRDGLGRRLATGFAPYAVMRGVF